MTEPSAMIAALAKAQAEMTNALKDADNPHFKSKYADLASVRAAVIGPLNKYGFAIVQQPETDADGAVFVRTMLLHESGGSLTHEGPHVMPAKRDAQGIGSAITYLRRYNLAAVCGVAPDDDDDGNAASFAPTRGSGTSQSRNDTPAVNSRKRADAPEPRVRTVPGEATDDPLFIPVGKKHYANGAAYDDWTGWKKALADAAKAALQMPDAKDALDELFAANEDSVEAFGKSPEGTDGGMRGFISWREGTYARVEQPETEAAE
jgi:hypothetical protein